MDQLSVILIVATMLLLFYLHSRSQQTEPKIEKCNCSHPDFTSSSEVQRDNRDNRENRDNSRDNLDKEEKVVYYYPQYPNPWDMNRRLYYDRFYDRAGGYDLYSYGRNGYNNHNNHNNNSQSPPVSINNHNNINYPREPQIPQDNVNIKPIDNISNISNISKNMYSGSATISKETFQN